MIGVGEIEKDSQGRSSLGTEFTVEDENGFRSGIATSGWLRLQGILPKQKLLDRSGGIHIESTGDMAPIVLVVESAIDDVISRERIVEDAIQKIVDLETVSERHTWVYELSLRFWS